MAVQTTYSLLPSAAVAGMLDQTFEARDIVTRMPAATMTTGQAASVSGTAGAAAKTPAAAGDVAAGTLLGVVPFDPTRSSLSYTTSDPMPIVRKGRVWVTVEEAVNDGDQAYVRITTHSSNTPGGWRKSADTVSAVDTAVAAPGCYFRTSASSGGLALLELNLP